MNELMYGGKKWHLDGFKVNIEGSGGNALSIIAKIGSAIERNYGSEDANEYRQCAMGHVAKQLGITDWSYDDVLGYSIATTGIQFTSTRELGVDSELYTIVEPDTYL